jgi:type VI secretion system secreted protein VgrG
MSRLLEISTSAGASAFLVQRFSGREELGRLFEYQVELLSERGDITAEQLLGTNATVALEMSDGDSTRYFNGYITSFSVQGQVATTAFKGNTGYLYLATLNPGLWFRTRSANSQIFSSMSIGDIVTKQVNLDGLMQVESKVGTTETRDFVVQYRETDFNFVSRLAEHAGIYYYFTHENGSHKMVLLNNASDHQVTPGLAQVSFSGEGRENTTLSGWRVISQVRAGAFATGDYNHVMPNTNIAADFGPEIARQRRL